MVGRILGMGDVLGLIEKVEEAVDHEKAQELARKLRRAEFTLEDYRDQLRQVTKMGSLDQVLGMIPGLGRAARDVDTEAGERELRRAGAIIDSMTPRERREPSLINGSRRKRIAKGSGTRVEDVNRVLKQFVQARKLMKQFSGASGGKMMKRFMAAQRAQR
jgi:signal recognition particle subunit SRP54